MPVSKKTKRRLCIAAIAGLGLPLLLVLILLLRLGPVLHAGIERAGQRLLGVETRLDHVSVSLRKGRLQLSELWVANPEGFKYDTFLKADVIRVEANVAALHRNEIHVRDIFLASPEISFERTGKRSNIDVLLERLRRENGSDGGGEPGDKKESGEPLRLKVDHLRVKDAKVRLVLNGTEVTATLGSIEMSNLQDADGHGLPMREVVRRFITNIADKVKGFADMSEDMQSLADDLNASWHSEPSRKEPEEPPVQ